MIEREYYPLKIAAGMIGCTVDDLICLGGTGKIKILAKAFGLKAMKFDSNGNPVTKEIETISDDYCLVHPDSIKHYETGRSIGRDDYEISDYLDSLLMPDKSGGFWNLAMRDEFIKMTDETLFVPNACIKQLKAQSETQVMGTKEIRKPILNEPSRKDAWFAVIKDMATCFYNEHDKIPNTAQAWGRLCERPPAGYEITTGKDKGEECLNMPGEKPLSRSAFNKRWSSYTADNGE